jgi:pimeloyl-ACP methyl ester carboxylesterase
VERPETRYAKSGELSIAYQVVGEGPLDLVMVPALASNIELSWDLPFFADFLERLSSFARLILFDRRGNGMSDGSAGATPLEGQVDDVTAVLAAAGVEQPALFSILEGCSLATMFAASRPDLVRAMVMIAPNPRPVRGPGYEFAPSTEEREARMANMIEKWGSASSEQGFIAGLARGGHRREWARWQSLAMGPAGLKASLALHGETDVRELLRGVQCPTLVMRPEDDTAYHELHSRYVAEHIPDARYLEFSGAGPIWLGAADEVADEVEHFLTGTRRPAVIREEVGRHRGRFVKSLGDGALAVFDGPSRAIDAATAIRARLGEIGLEVRAGLHTGECELLPDDDIGGLAVHIGSRVSSLASPGEVLVSGTVRDLVVGSGHVLSDSGEHELKGVPGRWRLYSLAG